MNEIKKQTITLDAFQKSVSKPIPTTDELLESLSKWHSTLHDAFGYSLPRSRDVLKGSHSKNASKWFRPQIIRYYVNDFLHQKGLKSQLVNDNDSPEEKELIYEPRVLPGNGIAGNFNGFEYRILKICNGSLPPPTTQPRKDFYNQLHLKSYQPAFPSLENYNNYKLLMKPNLVYLWEIIKNKFNLYLAIPNGAISYSATKLTLIVNPIISMKQKEAETNTNEVGQNDDLRRAHQTST